MTPEAMTPLQKLEALAAKHHFRVTSTTGGHHAPGSLHYLGRAIDVSVRGKSDREIEVLLEDAKAQGFRWLDERHPPWDGRTWSGSHIHLSDPPEGWTGGA